MNTLKSDIQNYIETEITEIGKPVNPSKKQVYKFKSIDISINLLFELLNKSNEVNEPTLQRVADNFFNHTAKIIEFNVKELPSAIEGLATNFEPFLKLIAYIKYKDTEFWEPNGDCAGISKTTLYNLINGKINNKFSVSPDIPLQNIPEPLIEYQGMKRTILDFVRTELRNAVHNAKRYSRMELMHYSNIVLSCYLFAIEDNYLFLKQLFLKEYQYLKKVVSDKNYVNLDKVYVELLGHEEYTDIDVTGTELIDEFNLLSEIEKFSEPENEDDFEYLENEKRTDNIIKIASDTLHLEIIGQGGSGKTTTLYKILYNNAQEIIKGDANKRIPFFIRANEYSPNNNFIEILSKNIDKQWIINSLKKGKLQLLIDGLNEISEEYKQEANREINNILYDYPENSIILTERKLNFERHFDIPVFELKDLNEEKIHLFIQKYAKHHSETIWNDLQSNENMLNLAYNPLMLKMILSVSKQGNIPKNRGLLYQLFIKTIFNREKTKRNQIIIDTKLDILSHIAFKMREEGKVSFTISKFKNLISQKLSNINSTVNTNKLYLELLDNLIISETQNEDVSFFHETYQEYFCAIQLKYNFEISGELSISFYDKRWFETLIMCGELLKNDKSAISFFEYVFRGQKSINNPKCLKDFSKEDFNENINIACKIAYSLKPIKPNIYKLAERYISNYLVLWKYLYYKKKIEPIKINELFSSVASLNSKKIIEKIIFNFGWVNIWLYEGDEEITNNFYIEKVIKEYKNSLQNIIISAISNNTPDFSTFYDTINNNLDFYFFSNEIQKKLKNFNNGIINSIHENQLKTYYKRNQNFDVFLEILKNDIFFISNYDFLLNEKKENRRVIKLLIKYHIQNENAHQVFKKQIYSLSEKTINYLLNRLFYFKQNQILFDLFEILIEENIDIFYANISLLQAIPFEKLSTKLQSEFKTNRTSDNIPFELIKEEQDKTFSCYIPIKYYNKIILNVEYLTNKGNNIEIQKIEGVKTLTLIASNISINNNTYPKHGDLIIGNYSTEFINCKLSKNGDKYIFTLSSPDFKSKNNINLKENDDIIINNEKWSFIGWSSEQITSTEFCTIRIAVKNNINFPEKGYLHLKNDIIDFSNPYKYHPSNLIKDNKIIKTLKNNIDEPIYINFIKKIGWSYIFHKNLENINYGIILDIYNDWIKIFSIANQKILELHNDTVLELKKEDIIIIEQNNTINPVSEKDEFLTRIGYYKSEIVYINEERKEGFIKMMGYNNSSDYFFHFRSCNFIPQVGDFVKFIPALNPSKNHQNEPIALKITKIELPKCHIIYSKYDDKNEYIWGNAIDILSDEKLFFRLNFGQEKYIRNIKNRILENQIYEYSVIKEKTEDFFKLIKLIKQLE